MGSTLISLAHHRTAEPSARWPSLTPPARFRGQFFNRPATPWGHFLQLGSACLFAEHLAFLPFTPSFPASILPPPNTACATHVLRLPNFQRSPLHRQTTKEADLNHVSVIHRLLAKADIPPSMKFLTPSTAFLFRARAYCIPLPTLGFVTFQAAQTAIPATLLLPFEATPPTATTTR